MHSNFVTAENQDMRKILFLILSLLLFSCQEETTQEPHPPKSGSYISSYMTNINSVSCYQIFNDKTIHLDFLLLGDNIIYGNIQFDSIARYYNDTSYLEYSMPTNIGVLTPSIKEIHVHTLKKLNEHYDSNSQIDDIVNIQYSSPYNYINSLYKEGIQTSFDKKLSDFNTTGTKLFVNGFSLSFQDITADNGSYPCIITITTSNEVITHDFNLLILKR